MATRRIDRRIDDALLATATWAGFLYVRRRVRRIVSELAIAAVMAVGVGALVALAAALGWKRSRTKPPASIE